MVLFYVWIEKFKNLENKGFTLTGDFKFHTEVIGDTPTVTIKKGTKLPDTFFNPPISSISGIIGKNASGKTNFFNFLISQVVQNEDDENCNGIFIYRNNSGQCRVLSRGVNLKLKSQTEEFSHEYEYIEGNELPFEKNEDFKTISLVYFSSIIGNHKTVSNSSGNFHNLSYDYLFRQYAEREKGALIYEISEKIKATLVNEPNSQNISRVIEDHFEDAILQGEFSQIDIFRKRENRIQAEFIFGMSRVDFGSFSEFIRFPPFVEIYLEENKYISVINKAQEMAEGFPDSYNAGLYRFIKGIQNNIQEAPEELKFLYNLYFASFLYHIRRYYYGLLISKEMGGSFPNIGGNDIPEQVLNYLRTFPNSSPGKIDFMEKMFREAANLFSGNKEGISQVSITRVKISRLCYEETSYFLYQYKSSYDVVGFLGFDWSGLSSGEMSIMSMLGRFYLNGSGWSKFNWPHLIGKVNGNFILLLDEPDIFLHPEWQRQLIEYLNFLMGKLYAGEEKIQIIISTHSPLLISDIPYSNVCFLDNKPDSPKDLAFSQTFASNIHSIYSQGFFLDNTIGAFAEGIIQEIIDFLLDRPNPKSRVTSRKVAQEYIRLVGEFILRNELQRMLDSKRLEEIDEIREIKEELRELKKKIEEEEQ